MADPEILAIRRAIAANPRPPDLASRRTRLDGLSALYPLPADASLEPVRANGVPAEWTTTPQADPARVLLYLHGGGYVSGSILSHRQLVIEAGRQAAARTLALDYRLAPENHFPAALHDVLAGYRFLLSSGFDRARIVIAGDSAGGGLTIAALVSLRDAGEPLPACAWCISPWVDLTQSGESMQTKAAADPIIQKDYLEDISRAYLHRTNPHNPLASPLYANLENLPPLLIQVGTAEGLLDDAVRLADRAAQADLRVTLETWPDMIHVWHLWYPQLSAGRRALASAGSFIRTHMA